METRICCAHNVTRGCTISSRVTVAHLAIQPLKALKVLLNGLALDSESSLWLTPLLSAPMTLRLFPFDLVYLDAEMRVLEAVELLPNVPLPAFGQEVTSALILPLHRLSTSGTAKGDRLLICTEAELQSQLGEMGIHLDPVEAEPPAPVTPPAEIVSADVEDAAQTSSPSTMPGPRISVPIRTSKTTPGAGFTVSLTTTWQITSSTMASAALPELEREEGGISPEPAEPQGEIEDLRATEGPQICGPVVAASEPRCEPATATETIREPSVIAQQATVPVGIHEVLEIKTDVEQTPEAGASPRGIDAAPETIVALAKATAEAIQIIEVPEAERREPAVSNTEDLIASSKEAWEKAHVVTPHPAASPKPAKTKKKAPEPKKDHLGTRVIRWLALDDPLPERRKIIRLLLEGLQAYEADGHPARYELRDICPTGFCLKTQKQWKRGEIRSIVLEKKGASEHDREHRVRVPARVIRCDEDGVGLEFAFLDGTEFEPWKRASTKRSDETEADFIVRELRFASALGFLRRLCPRGTEEIRHALLERLSNKRVLSAIDIVLMAEESLVGSGNAGKVLAQSDVVMRILESGSWIEDAWIRELWSGLLVSSCAADDQDRSNMPLVDLMARLTPLHLRVLSHVCRKGAEAVAAGKTVKELRFDFTAEELMEAADSHSFMRIQQTIGQLADHGLVSEPARPSYVAMNEKASTSASPTLLGLKMYARWHGQRG